MQRGNILFLIFLAVMLFAALNYAIVQEMRGGSSKATPTEKWDAAIAEIQNHVTDIQTAIHRMVTVGRIPLHEIDFYSLERQFKDGTSLARDNTACTSSRCEVFNKEGGGIPFRHFRKYASPLETLNPGSAWAMPGDPMIEIVRINNVGSDLPDIIMSIQGLDINLAKAINMKFYGTENPGLTSATSLNFSGADVETRLSSSSTAGTQSGTVANQPNWCWIAIDYQSHGTFANCTFLILAR